MKLTTEHWLLIILMMFDAMLVGGILMLWVTADDFPRAPKVAEIGSIAGGIIGMFVLAAWLTRLCSSRHD